MKYPRAGQPTTREIAETIERLRNLLFFEYGADNYAFTVVANGATLASATRLTGVIEAVVKES